MTGAAAVAGAHVRRYLPRYAAATAAALFAFGLRLVLEPWLRDTHPFGAFYPAVFLVTYVLGRGPALLAAVVSASLGSWAFSDPRFGWSAAPEALAPLVFFAVTVGAGVWLIGALTSALDTLAMEQGRSKAIADAHAELFKDLQSRIGHHMQLIAGVLLLQSRGEPDPDMVEVLRAASERSRLIARAHRAFSDRPEADIDFVPFATALAHAVCQETAQADSCVEIAAGDVWLPSEMATSLGIALVECLQLVLKRKPSGVLRIALVGGPDQVCMSLSHTGDAGAALISQAPGIRLLRAMAEQLGAEVRTRVDDDGEAAFEMALPMRMPGAPPAAPPVAPSTLH